MTTIVYRDGIMAADTRGYSGEKYPLGLRLKVRRLDNGDLLGVSSNKVGQADCVASWFQAKETPVQLTERLAAFDAPSFKALLVAPDGTGRLYDDSGWPSEADGPYYALGSGEDFAYGALGAGLSAVRALTVAIEMDPWSDWPVMCWTHDSPDASTLKNADGLP